ncbi:MAG: ParA family protein [Nitrospiraceae bacterium]
MAEVIAVANQKGGVGKTTTSVNFATFLAVSERSVLLVDMDPQANATSGLGIDTKDLTKTVYDCMVQGVKIEEVIVPTAVTRLSIAPATADLVGAEVELVSIPGRETLLKNAIQGVHDRFDYIVLDCPPALGLLTINALTAASSVLVPLQCEYYAMEGLGRLMANVERVQQSFNPALELEGIVLTMFDSRNSLSKQVADEIRAHFKDKVYRTVIPRNVALAEAPSFGRPALLYNAASTGSQAYLQLAKEFLNGKKSTR